MLICNLYLYLNNFFILLDKKAPCSYLFPIPSGFKILPITRDNLITLPEVDNISAIKHSPRGVLRISNDREDWRIFLGLKILISGFFWVGKFWQVFFR